MPQADRPVLEVCVDTATGLQACQAGADRVELCSALALGGLTPSPGLIRQAAESSLPAHAMIRPRAGDFDFDGAEIATALADIDFVRHCGLAGVVLGAARGDGLDLAALRAMTDAAPGLDWTLHRVIDLLPDPLRAMEQVIDLGFTRILTSGRAARAVDGLAQLARLQDAAAGRIEIMAGSGVTAATVPDIARATGITAFHASCSRSAPEPEPARRLGFAQPLRSVTDRAAITALRAALDALPTPRSNR